MAMLTANTDVEVRSTFDGSWVKGFAIVEAMDHPVRCYRLRRRSDGFVLPRLFPAASVRRLGPSATVSPRRRLIA